MPRLFLQGQNDAWSQRQQTPDLLEKSGAENYGHGANGCEFLGLYTNQLVCPFLIGRNDNDETQ